MQPYIIGLRKTSRENTRRMSVSETIPELPQEGPKLRRVKTRSYATGRTIMALVLREMSTRYGRTPGGYI